MWTCLECGRKFRTVKAAEKASYNGCPGCGGVDIDFVTEGSRERHRLALGQTGSEQLVTPTAESQAFERMFD
jgi:predicted  nucleic acid-binding Zn-ribbon protein